MRNWEGVFKSRKITMLSNIPPMINDLPFEVYNYENKEETET
jgi:hypothetical protein